MFNSIKLNSHGLFSSELRQFFAQKTKLFLILIFSAPPTSPSSCVYDWRCFRKKLSLRISQYSQESCRHATLLKKESNTGFFQYCKFFKNIYFEEHLLTAAFDFLKQRQNTDEQLLLSRLG